VGGRAIAAEDRICIGEDAGHIVLWRGFPDGIETVVRAPIVARTPAGPKTLQVSFADADCRIVDNLTMQGDGALVRPIVLDGDNFLLVTAADHGGSGSMLTHVLLEVTSAGLKRIGLPDVRHSNMGGFFVGDLGKGIGAGAVVWEADWTAGRHYDPHPYTFVYYRWVNSKFTLLRKMTTVRSYESSNPDAVIKGLGLGFGDLSLEQAMPSAL
jgi:hypothetical protein